MSDTPRTNAVESDERHAWEMRRECGWPAYPCGWTVLARELEAENAKLRSQLAYSCDQSRNEPPESGSGPCLMAAEMGMEIVKLHEQLAEAKRRSVFKNYVVVSEELVSANDKITASVKRENELRAERDTLRAQVQCMAKSLSDYCVHDEDCPKQPWDRPLVESKCIECQIEKSLAEAKARAGKQTV